jgi:Skp family chaperone for outer membrane proteins
MEINQAKLEADRKADQGHMQDMLAKMDSKQEKVDAIHKEMARIDDNQRRL